MPQTSSVRDVVGKQPSRVHEFAGGDGGVTERAAQVRLAAAGRENRKAVPISGGPGMAVLFHCNMVYGSGHNLSPNDRWHVYVAYNPSKNRSNPIPASPRPDYVVSRNYAPLQMLPDDSLREPVPA